MTEQNDRLDREASLALSVKVDAKVKQCYRNSVMALLTAVDEKDFYYVEGAFVIDGMPIPFEHGWLERKSDGMVVDPTLVVSHKGDVPAVTYFAATKYSASAVRKLAFKTSLPFSLFTKNDGDHQAFRKAHFEAMCLLGFWDSETRNNAAKMLGIEE